MGLGLPRDNVPAAFQLFDREDRDEWPVIGALPSPRTVFFKALENRDPLAVISALDKGMDVRFINSLGQGLIHIVLEKVPNVPESAIILLINRGVDPRLVNNTGDTILHYAIRYRNLSCVSYIAENYPELLAKIDNYGKLPIHRAISSNEILTHILDNYPEYRANLNVEMLYEAIGNDPTDIKVVETLLNAGIDPHTPGYLPLSPAELAEFRGKRPVIELIERFNNASVSSEILSDR